MAGYSGNAPAAEISYDFRIVIDVSGSMKQTDPHNLRVPALKLLNGLVPTGSRAGVWTFGRYVDMTVKWSKVDDAWRGQADMGADKIHSNALFTNIESALARASVGWDKPDASSKRILLLLTDGQVDVSKDPEKNKKSRAKVLGKSLAAIKAAGAEVHAIALSKSSDEVLLKQLALDTGGSFAIAQSAGELQKIFFKMFERASKPDTVALKGKEFPVDASIKEMTLLIFRNADSPPTILIPPDSPAISAEKMRGSRWRSDQGYDLITIKNPQAGTWRIDAEMDLDNRLMVVTDLKLKADGVPAYSAPGETLTLTAELFNREQKIRKNSFLRFVEFNLTHIDAEGNEKSYVLEPAPERDEKGTYLHRFEQKLAEGTHQLVFSADSRTFNRSKRFNLEVQWPAEVVIEPAAAAGVYELKVRARAEYLKPDGFVAEVEIEAPDGSKQSLAMDAESGWLRGQIDTDQDGLYQAHVRVSGQSNAIEIVDVDLGTFAMLGIYRENPVTHAIAPEVEIGTIHEAQKPATPSDTIDWRLVGVVTVSVNLFLLLLLLVGWQVLRRKNRPAELALDEQEIDA